MSVWASMCKARWPFQGLGLSVLGKEPNMQWRPWLAHASGIIGEDQAIISTMGLDFLYRVVV